MGSPAIIAGSAVITGAAAFFLTDWLTVLAQVRSVWIRSRTHSALAAAGGAGAGALADTWIEVVTFAGLALACALLVVVDLAAYRLPNAIVGPLYALLFTGLTIAGASTGDWPRLGRAVAAALMSIGLYLVVGLLRPSGLGLGDVKLAGALGGFLGWLGWSNLAAGSLAPFALGGVVALLLLLTGAADRNGHFPFGPWMVAGAALGAALGSAAFPALG